MLAVGLSASRSNRVTEQLMSRASPKSIPASSCAAQFWLVAAFSKNHGTSHRDFSYVNEVPLNRHRGHVRTARIDASNAARGAGLPKR